MEHVHNWQVFIFNDFISSFNVAGYDQLMKFLDLSQQQLSSGFFSTVVVPLQLEGICYLCSMLQFNPSGS